MNIITKARLEALWSNYATPSHCATAAEGNGPRRTSQSPTSAWSLQVHLLGSDWVPARLTHRAARWQELLQIDAQTAGGIVQKTLHWGHSWAIALSISCARALLAFVAHTLPPSLPVPQAPCALLLGTKAKDPVHVRAECSEPTDQAWQPHSTTYHDLAPQAQAERAKHLAQAAAMTFEQLAATTTAGQPGKAGA
jgi:hypothetical protein